MPNGKYNRTFGHWSIGTRVLILVFFIMLIMYGFALEFIPHLMRDGNDSVA